MLQFETFTSSVKGRSAAVVVHSTLVILPTLSARSSAMVAYLGRDVGVVELLLWA